MRTMKESWIIVRDNKPLLPWREPTREYRKAKDIYEYKTYLTLKIHEEVQEVMEAALTKDKWLIIEELSDVYEVILCLWSDWELFCMYQPDIQAIISDYNISQEYIINAADEKRKTHWSFKQAILLNHKTVEG